MVRVGFGMSNEEIADDLGCSPTTVRTHTGDALRRLKVRNRAHAIGLLYRTGTWTDDD